MKSINKILFLAIFLLANLPQLAYSQTATLLPNAEQQFIDGSGQPYAGGSVFFDVPNTTSPKTTWQNAAGSVPNTNPVILDSAGRAIIYGIGQYREILKDSDGNQIWDQLTQDVFSLVTPGQTIWGGTATGTANALLLTSTPAITTLGPGQVVSFIAGITNTGSATANVSSIGIKNILATTPAGTANVIAGNLVANGRYFMLYDGNEFILLNPTSNAGGNGFTTIASATTTDIGVSPTTNIIVSGTNTITSFGSSASTSNPLFVVQFSGSLQITYNVSTMITPNGQNLITQPGDYALLRYLGTGSWQVLSYFPASGYIGKINPQIFNSPGSYTYTPCNNLLYDIVEMVGGGGGGAGNDTTSFGSAGGGGSGGYIKAFLTGAQIGSTQAITIGTGGNSGAVATNGGNGGTTSLGALISVGGGNGGSYVPSQAGAPGGAGGSVTLSTGTTLLGIIGQSGAGGANVSFGAGGGGGSSPMGSGAPTNVTGTALNGVSGTGFGAGGSGGACGTASGNVVGGAGTSGNVIILEYCLR